ncbi:MAG: hypothetical protein Q4Q58_01960 [Thermoplasmata archaeon]|nr:hypothetical protein [Thermoplasmata archaeon]
MHCKDVSMHEVGFPLDEDSIARLMDGWRSYVRTDALVLKSGDEFAVVELRKRDGKGLFRELDGYSIVSLPEDTVFVEDPNLDVLNLPAMAELQSKHLGKAVVVRGMFSHISYVKGLEPLVLTVVDNVPPSPSKLGVLVRMALASGFVELPIVVRERIIDMASKVPEVETPAVMFPCRVSHLEASIPFYFLDDAPELEDDVTLIGCHLSHRIYLELYGREVPFINVCPADHTVPGEKSIVKCCKVKQGHELDGDVVRVPWGATVPEVVSAINDLFSSSGN